MYRRWISKELFTGGSLRALQNVRAKEVYKPVTSMWSPLWNTLKRPSEARAKSFRITSPSTRVHVRNLPLTADYSALIFTETFIKNGSDRCFLWQTQAPTSKLIETPALIQKLTKILPLFFMPIERDERLRNIQHCVEYSLQLAR